MLQIDYRKFFFSANLNKDFLYTEKFMVLFYLKVRRMKNENI